MENKELKIKSYLYIQQNLLILFTILSALISFIVGICYKPFSIACFSTTASIACCFFIGFLITRLGCKTYDIYNEKGVMRVRGNKIIFDIPWNYINYYYYESIEAIFILQPCVLHISLKKPLNYNEERSYDNKYFFSTPMSKKVYKEVVNIIPIELKNIKSTTQTI